MSEVRWIRQPGVLTAEVSGEAVLMDPGGGTYFSLNRTGFILWSALEHARSRNELIGDLAVAVGQEKDRVAPDVDRFLDRLAELALIGRA